MEESRREQERAEESRRAQKRAEERNKWLNGFVLANGTMMILIEINQMYYCAVIYYYIP